MEIQNTISPACPISVLFGPRCVMPSCMKTKHLDFILVFILFIFSMCVYSLGFSISTDDHPYPPHRSVTLSPKSQIATNLTTCLFFMIILLYILGKVTIHHSSKVRFVPISTNLNLLKKNVIPSSSYCHFEQFYICF